MVTNRITEIGKIIKNKRITEKISQKDFAKELGISYSYLCRIENGKLDNYTIDVLIKICEKLNINILNLISYE
jgi:transcriptional regulator with XRE-family HTH domain